MNASAANVNNVRTTDSGHVQKSGMTRSVDPSAPNAFNWMTPTGGKKVSGHLEWGERGDILPIELLSGDAADVVDPENPICQKSIQNRGNHGKANDDKAEAASLAEGATEKGYVAEYAWNDTRTDSGAELCIYVPVEKAWKGDVPEGAKPYVKNGKVLIRLAGYGRDLRLGMLAENHSYNDAYLYKTVGQALDEYGLAMPEDIRPENQPRLIRVVDDMRGTKYSDLVIMSNNAAVSKLDDPSQARQDADLIRAGGFAHLLVFNRDGEVNVGESDEFFSRFDKVVRTLQNKEGEGLGASEDVAEIVAAAFWRRAARELREGVMEKRKIAFATYYAHNLRWLLADYYAGRKTEDMDVDLTSQGVESMDRRVFDGSDSKTVGDRIADTRSSSDADFESDEDRRRKVKHLMSVLDAEDRTLISALMSGKSMSAIAREAGVTMDEALRSFRGIQDRARGIIKGQAASPSGATSRTGYYRSSRQETSPGMSQPSGATSPGAVPRVSLQGSSSVDIIAEKEKRNLTRDLSWLAALPPKMRLVVEAIEAEPDLKNVDVARKLKLSASGVDKYVSIAKSKYGWVRPVKSSPYSATQRAVVEMFEAGESPDVIASTLGITLANLWNQVRIAKLKGWKEADEIWSRFRKKPGRPASRRFSVAPQGVQKGAGVEYPDAGEELRALSDATMEMGQRWSVGQLYTGSAADYEKPSLHYVGTGSGSQEYGHGLYGTVMFSTAEGYAGKRGNIYEQTWFTDREEGDESHLINWHEPLSEDNFKRVENALSSVLGDRVTKNNNGDLEVFAGNSLITISPQDRGGNVYDKVSNIVGSARDASSLLANFGIDGTKYVFNPREDLKLGEDAAWNYVSFRDDNIRVDHKWVDGQQRWSVAASPTLREDVEAALLKRDAAHPDAMQKGRHDEIVFSENIPVFEFLGLPNRRVVTEVSKIRKFAIKHHLSVDQIVDIPNGYDSPVAIMRDEDGYVLLTDRQVTTDDGEQKPMRLFLRPTKWRSGEIVLLATAMAENGREELEYYEPRLKAGLMFADENRIAGLNLGEETESILRIQASGDNVKTAADFSAWKSTQESIAKSATDDKGPRWSIGARRRAEFRELMRRKRPDIAPEDIEAYLDEIAGYESAKKQKLAVHWLITGAIELSEDAYKLDKAIATAERAKVDPFQYRNPEDIFAAFPQHLPKDPAIDPDTVPELTGKEERGHGITVYNVQDDREGQAAMRRIINTHFGKDASPWCLLQGEGDTGELSDQAWHYWQHYSSLPKKVAFLNGRLLAFMATDRNVIDDVFGLYVDLRNMFPSESDEYDEWLETDEGQEEQASFLKWMSVNHHELLLRDELVKRIPEQWWDRKDRSHDGIPIEGKIAGDALGRSGLRELKDGELKLVGRMWKGDRKNGMYEEWSPTGNKVLEEWRKNGAVHGWRRKYFDNIPGRLKAVEHFDEHGSHDRPALYFNSDFGLSSYIEYGERDIPTLNVAFQTDGTLRSYGKHESPAGLAKASVQFGYDSMSVAWTDDAGDYYSTLADGAGQLRSAEKIPNGYYGKQPVDLSDAAVRSKLEGESAAVLEAVKAEAAAIYREYSAVAGTVAGARVMDDAAQDARWSIGQLYTGSAADYEKPSLLKVGTGEGSQVYGWGLYASSARGVAEGYASRDERTKYTFDGKPFADAKRYGHDYTFNGSVLHGKDKLRAFVAEVLVEQGGKEGALKFLNETNLPMKKSAIAEIEKNAERYGSGNGNIYEQTFFTNRAPGDESHLLKWYEPVSEEQKKWIIDALNENLQAINDRSEVKYGKFTIENGFVKTQMTLLDGSKQTATWDLDKGERAYGMVSSLLGSPEIASKLLAEHDIDGIKYPVDSYGKTVKDGDKAGWNYVSFRDDNIRVDHKWVDGQQRWSIGRDAAWASAIRMDYWQYKRANEQNVGRIRFRGRYIIYHMDPETGIFDIIHDIPENSARVDEYERSYGFTDDAAHEGDGWDSHAAVEASRIRQDQRRVGGAYPENTGGSGRDGGLGGRHSVTGRPGDALQGEGDRPGVSAESAGALTQSQAKYILKFSPDTFRDRAIAQGNEGSGRVPGEALGAPASAEVSRPKRQEPRHSIATAADNPLAAIANARTTREVEAAARMSFSARLADGDEGAAERALVNYVAYHKLTGGATPRAITLAKLGLALGMKTVQAKRILEDAQRVADRAVGTVIEKAARNGDVGTAFSLMEREKEREEELRKIISGGAKAGGDLVLGGVVAQGTLLGKRVEQTMRGMTAATLADMEGDTGLDLAAEILQNDPKAFDDELKKGRGKSEEGRGKSEEGRGGEDGEPETDNQQPETNNQLLTDREKWKRAEAAKAAAKRVAEFIEAAKRRAEENRKKAEERMTDIG